MFDYDDSVNLAFDAKVAGKKVVTAKHELLSKTGDFFFMAHSERELAQRMQMVEEDIEKVAYHKLSNVSDSKAKLVRAVLDEWSLRHASCSMCKTANPDHIHDPNTSKETHPSWIYPEGIDHTRQPGDPNRPKTPKTLPLKPNRKDEDDKTHPDKTAAGYDSYKMFPKPHAWDSDGNVTHDENGTTQHGFFSMGTGHGTMQGWTRHQAEGTAPCMHCTGVKSSYDNRVALDKAVTPPPGYNTDGSAK